MSVLERGLEGVITSTAGVATAVPGTTFTPLFADPEDPTNAGDSLDTGYYGGVRMTLTNATTGSITVTAWDGIPGAPGSKAVHQAVLAFTAPGESLSDCLDCLVPIYNGLRFNLVADTAGMDVDTCGVAFEGVLTPKV